MRARLVLVAGDPNDINAFLIATDGEIPADALSAVSMPHELAYIDPTRGNYHLIYLGHYWDNLCLYDPASLLSLLVMGENRPLTDIEMAAYKALFEDPNEPPTTPDDNSAGSGTTNQTNEATKPDPSPVS